MKTLADLKRCCTPGTVVEVERLLFKPSTYLAVVAEHKERHCGLVTVDRAQVGTLDWSRAKDWQFTEDAATQYSRDEEPIALLRLRFLSAEALALLPDEVKQLSQKYQPETAVRAAVRQEASAVTHEPKPQSI